MVDIINPRREQSQEEIDIIKSEQDRKKRDEENRKIRCPACRKNQYFDHYLANPKLGVLVCPLCGVLFMDAAKLKIIKKNVANASSPIIKPR